MPNGYYQSPTHRLEHSVVHNRPTNWLPTTPTHHHLLRSATQKGGQIMCAENEWDYQSRGAYVALHYIWLKAEAYSKGGKKDPATLEAWRQIQFEIQETRVDDIIPGLKK